MGEISRLKTKTNSYHQQDVKKGRIAYNTECSNNTPNKLVMQINLRDLVELINEEYEMHNSLECFYCNKYIYIIPLKSYDPLQLTMDRINNALPHTKDNLVICCYLCNTIRSNNWSSKQFKRNRRNANNLKKIDAINI